ncbi:MAG TPA: alpha/beta hydrolase [Prolixibacteraceae bacterium]|nr:alpha/beta hydrolase [Prolixibacteraceae bacterium]
MKNLFIPILLLTMILISCEKESTNIYISDHLFLRSNKADMPIFVEGNYASKDFVIVLHGGPGDDILVFKELFGPFTDKLEENYVMVYWQQRCAGSSQGNVDSENIQLSDYVTDMEKLIILLKHQYGNDINVYLMGHSWGGALGSMFLLKDNNQMNIKGWIEICGNHDFPLTFQLEQEKIIATGKNQIAIGNNTETWNNLIEKANNCDLNTIEGKLAIYVLTDEAYKLMVSVDSVIINDFTTKETLDGIFFHPYNPFSNIVNMFAGAAVNKDYMDLSLNNDLHKIKIPSLFLYSEYDFTVPSKLGHEAFEQISTNKKEFIILYHSEHWPMRTEPDKCSNAIISFIEKYK